MIGRTSFDNFHALNGFCKYSLITCKPPPCWTFTGQLHHPRHVHQSKQQPSHQPQRYTVMLMKVGNPETLHWTLDV